MHPLKDYVDGREQAVEPEPILRLLPDKSLDRAIDGDADEQMRRLDGFSGVERLVLAFGSKSVYRWLRIIATTRGESL